MRKIPAIVRKEKGCIEYQSTIDVDPGSRFQIKYRPEAVIVLEKWESLEALNNHGMASHISDFRHAAEEFYAVHAITDINTIQQCQYCADGQVII